MAQTGLNFAAPFFCYAPDTLCAHFPSAPSRGFSKDFFSLNSLEIKQGTILPFRLEEDAGNESLTPSVRCKYLRTLAIVVALLKRPLSPLTAQACAFPPTCPTGSALKWLHLSFHPEIKLPRVWPHTATRFLTDIVCTVVWLAPPRSPAGCPVRVTC